MPAVLTYLNARVEDAAGLTALVRRAYRGDDSRAGWTTEADLLEDERIDTAGMLAKITAPGGVVLTAEDASGSVVACCELARRAGGVAYFGMFAVEPALQAAGVGRQVLAEAERVAAEEWGATRMEMTVIAQRSVLIEWYERRGYARTGERREFPYDQLVNGRALRDDLYFVVLAKSLAAQPPTP